MVINGLIDISFTAVVGKMATVAFLGNVPLYRPMTLKKLKYTLKRYSPDVLVVFLKGNDINEFSEILSIYKAVVLMGYDYFLLQKYASEVENVVWLVPYAVEFDSLTANTIVRVSENVFLLNRKWFMGKERRVEVVSPTLQKIFEVRNEILYRKFWL